MNSIGKNIRKRRKELQVTQTQLAALTGLTNDYISKLEVGKRDNPSLEVTQKIAKALFISVEDLTKGTDLENTKEEVFPEKFENPQEARVFVNKHQVFRASDFDESKLNDSEILKFANDVLEMMKLVSYKYKK